MKPIIFLFSLLLIGQAVLVSIGQNCPEQHVPDLNNICIRPNFIQGCETYKNADQCFTCSKDYDLKNGLCFSTTSVDLNSNYMSGCLVENGKSCSNCANGYRRVQGVCQKGVKFCADYNSDQKCVLCEHGYSLIFGECKHNLMLGCKQEQTDHTCLDCFKPFQLKNFQCVISDCKSYNDYGCITCECGYFITQTHNCQPMQSGCLKYSRGTCVQCLSHYKLKGGVCTIEGCLQLADNLCTACKDDYQLVDGSCKFKNCSEWKNDKCLICNQGFNLEGGKCAKSLGKYICSG